MQCLYVEQAAMGAVTGALHGASPSLWYLSMSASLHASTQAIQALHAQLERDRKAVGCQSQDVQLAGALHAEHHEL